MRILQKAPLLLLLIVLDLHSQTPQQQLDSILYSHPEFNGTVLLMKQDSVVAKAVQGVADTSGTLLDFDSSFNLASVAKHITALAAARLMDENKLDYNSPVSKYLPQFDDPKYASIMISDLVHHTSGLPDFEELFKEHPSYSVPYATNDSMLELFKIHKPDLIFQPGEDYQYSNTGYIVLASVIEKVSGMKMGEYLQKIFFGPLGMNNAFGYSHSYKNKHPERVVGLKFSQDTIVHDLTNLDGIIGDGNVYMSINDLVKWERFLNSQDLLSEEWRQTYFRPGASLPEDADPYAFGWIVFEDRQVMQHAGGWVGFSTFYYRDLKSNITMIALSNGSISNENFFAVLKGMSQLRKELISENKS
jgi:CubicO group peptidase (beta-lactamase class C family)